ncbi:MAG TPA: hypothetical protein VF519_12110 [Mycobacteriales bacterium]|jgi:hypothetical protein
MFTRVLTTAALATAGTLALTVAAPPASAATPVVMCAAVSTGGVRGTCTFVGPPGNYRVDISHNGRYCWAEAVCDLGGRIFADAWDYERGFDSESGLLLGGRCTLTVAVSGGTGTGTVYYLAPV